MYQDPFTDAVGRDREVPLRLDWRALREENDDAAQQAEVAEDAQGPEEYLVEAAWVHQAGQEVDDS